MNCNIKNNFKKYRFKGYLSIEASLIMPMIILLFVFIIYFTCYLYNLCLIKQIAYVAALRGSQILNGSDAQIKEYVEEELEELLEKPLVYVSELEKSVNVSSNKVRVELSGKMNIAFYQMQFVKKNQWEIYGVGSANRVDPVTFIRNIRSVL